MQLSPSSTVIYVAGSGEKTEPNSHCNDSSVTRTISHSAPVRMNESAKELSCRRITPAKCIVDFWEPWEETFLFLYGTWKLAFTVDFFYMAEITFNSLNDSIISRSYDYFDWLTGICFEQVNLE